jgi:hypothetical protein
MSDMRSRSPLRAKGWFSVLSDVSRDIGGDEQRIHNVSTHYSGITFKHLLLPVYAGAYSFKRRVFQIVVNGRTGEIQGDRLQLSGISHVHSQ